MIREQRTSADRIISAMTQRGALLFVLGAALAGCQTVQDKPAGIWADYRERHPIEIVEKNRSIELFIASARNGLSPEQRAEVIGFARTWRGEGTGQIIIEQPVGIRNARAAAIALGEIRSILTAAGVPSQAIRVHSYRPEQATLAVIRVNYPRVAAQVEGCGQWPGDLGPADQMRHFENSEYWNLGCATRRNMAAMIENPSDLVQPRTEALRSSSRRTTVLEKYRKGESTATTYPDSNKGAISELGK